MPFIYRNGTVESIISDVVTVGVSWLESTYDTYTVPSGYNYVISSGQAVSRFDIILEAPALKDYINAPATINSLSGVNSLNYRSNVCFLNTLTTSDFNYSEDFHNRYVTSLMPKGITHQTITE